MSHLRNAFFLLALSALWCPPPARAECPEADLNGDGLVGAADLAILLGAWGLCSGPDMTSIPGGTYEMGCHVTTLGCGGNALPIHDVVLDPFEISITEVSNRQYRRFLNSALDKGEIEVLGGVAYKSGGGEPYCDAKLLENHIEWGGCSFTVRGEQYCEYQVDNRVHHAVAGVSWYGAAAYCNWLSTRHNRTPCYDLETWECDLEQNGFRLPTEAEWEYAARGGLHDPYVQYPWGNFIDFGAGMCNHQSSGDPWDPGLMPEPETTPAGYYDGNQMPPGVDMANGYGLHDVAGNVWEWCHDWYDADYYDSNPVDNPTGPATGTNRVKRGGAWDAVSGHVLRVSNRSSFAPDVLVGNTGFRVVRRD